MGKLKERAKLVMTGGHAATTAAGVVEEIISERRDWELFWIGSKKAIEGKDVLTLEYELLPKLGVKFLPINTGRLQRKFTWYTIPSLLKVPIGFFQALGYLLKIKPHLILSFGGYASTPVVISAKILRIPIIIHEQTAAAGRASIFTAKLADKIAVSRLESIRYFPKEKCVLTGNPVLSEITKVNFKSSVGSPPVVFITGGSRGSQSINDVVGIALPKLLSLYKIIHQTGSLDYKRFSEIKNQIPLSLSRNYEVFARVTPWQIAKIYDKADIIVSRAGANTVSEIMVIKRPGVLIPLPISYLDEQTKNAEIAEGWGIAKIISQKELTPELLQKVIAEAATNFSKIANNVKDKTSPDSKASEKLVGILSYYL